MGAIWTSPQLTQTGLETKNGMHPPNFPGARLSSFGTPHPPPPALLQGTRRSRNPGGPVLDTRQSPLQLKGGYGEGGLSGSRVRAGRAGVRPWPEMDGEAGRRHRPQNAQGPACTYCGAEGAGKGFPVCGGGGERRQPLCTSKGHMVRSFHHHRFFCHIPIQPWLRLHRPDADRHRRVLLLPPHRLPTHCQATVLIGFTDPLTSRFWQWSPRAHHIIEPDAVGGRRWETGGNGGKRGGGMVGQEQHRGPRRNGGEEGVLLPR